MGFIFRAIRAAILRRQQAAGQRRFEAGQQYVRETLQASGANPATLALLECQADNPFDSNEFEQGMLHELQQLSLTDTPINALAAQGA